MSHRFPMSAHRRKQQGHQDRIERPPLPRHPAKWSDCCLSLLQAASRGRIESWRGYLCEETVHPDYIKSFYRMRRDSVDNPFEIIKRHPPRWEWKRSPARRTEGTFKITDIYGVNNNYVRKSPQFRSSHYTLHFHKDDIFHPWKCAVTNEGANMSPHACVSCRHPSKQRNPPQVSQATAPDINAPARLSRSGCLFLSSILRCQGAKLLVEKQKIHNDNDEKHKGDRKKDKLSCCLFTV